MLALKELSCGYQSLPEPILNGVHTQLKPGTFICVVGRNGIGKSTLMRTIAGLQPALGGSVFINNLDVSKLTASERARYIAVVTTEKVSSPGLLVDDVLALGRLPYTNWQNRLGNEDKRIINEVCKLVKIFDFLGLPLNSLSDGQKQRVMIARALIQTPKIMILDEITAFLDLPSRVEIMVTLRKFAQKKKCIVMLSSHDLELSLELADKIWLMDGGQLHDGSPDELIEKELISNAFNNKDILFDTTQKRFRLNS